MDTQFYTLEAAQNKAAAIITLLALSKLRLCKSPFLPSQTTKKADLVAAEADFDGYPAGGYALTAWTGPGLPTDGGYGAVITSPTEIIVYGPPAVPPITNTLSAWWIETAAGHVWLVGTWNPARNATSPVDQFPVLFQSIEGRTAPPA